jgi:hypothetical protein
MREGPARLLFEGPALAARPLGSPARGAGQGGVIRSPAPRFLLPAVAVLSGPPKCAAQNLPGLDDHEFIAKAVAQCIQYFGDARCPRRSAQRMKA